MHPIDDYHEALAKYLDAKARYRNWYEGDSREAAHKADREQLLQLQSDANYAFRQAVWEVTDAS
jgi:hypothetical protein